MLHSGVICVSWHHTVLYTMLNMDCTFGPGIPGGPWGPSNPFSPSFPWTPALPTTPFGPGSPCRIVEDWKLKNEEKVHCNVDHNAMTQNRDFQMYSCREPPNIINLFWRTLFTIHIHFRVKKHKIVWYSIINNFCLKKNSDPLILEAPWGSLDPNLNPWLKYNYITAFLGLQNISE